MINSKLPKKRFEIEEKYNHLYKNSWKPQAWPLASFSCTSTIAICFLKGTSVLAFTGIRPKYIALVTSTLTDRAFSAEHIEGYIVPRQSKSQAGEVITEKQHAGKLAGVVLSGLSAFLRNPVADGAPLLAFAHLFWNNPFRRDNFRKQKYHHYAQLLCAYLFVCRVQHESSTKDCQPLVLTFLPAF
ncbi:hypothetical protein V6N13_079541 [Hibiscus sabdariffa]